MSGNTEQEKKLHDSELYYEKLSEYSRKKAKTYNYYLDDVKLERIEDKIVDQEEREKELKNNALEQDIQLKKNTLVILFIFLALETILVFVIAFRQGEMIENSFYLEEWSFRIIIIATISQITAMLTIAVKHLFPQKN